MNESPRRKQLRLKNWDYATPWWYFVTVCTCDMRLLFGNVVGATRGSPAKMVLNDYGKIVENVWKTVPEHHPVDLDVFQVMPNHAHFIIALTGGARSDETGGSRPRSAGRSRPTPTTLGTVVGLFKSECTKQIRRVAKNPNMAIWQRNYYEHIIRNERSLHELRFYITTNPERWDEDRNNPKNF